MRNGFEGGDIHMLVVLPGGDMDDSWGENCMTLDMLSKSFGAGWRLNSTMWYDKLKLRGGGAQYLPTARWMWLEE